MVVKAANKTHRILVTGGSAGLGAAIAEFATARGHHVLAGGRRFVAPHRAPELPSLITFPLDVQDEASCKAAVEEMERRFGGIDVVIANAGVASAGAFEETPLDEFRRVMDVNFFGAVRIAQAALPKMRAAGRGHIIAISSLSALIGLPGDSAYAASKHALEGAFEALAAEVSRFGVSITLAEPGGVSTEFMGEAFTASPPPASAYRGFNDAIRARALNKSAASPKAIAEEIVAIIEQSDGPLRRPVGDQARAVVDTLQGLKGKARAEFAERAAGLEWWSKGAASPLE